MATAQQMGGCQFWKRFVDFRHISGRSLHLYKREVPMRLPLLDRDNYSSVDIETVKK